MQKEESVLSVVISSFHGEKTRCIVIIHAGKEHTGDGTGL